MMSGPPLALHIDPTATPKPCHTLIPIPIHWQEEVKRGLDRDVRLGVFEKVPLGTPVTWCHQMVVCTKKNGSLRRTINFQPLNKHATRETHHCPAAFHQATEWLDICARNGITLNPAKFRFAKDKVEFAGFTVTPTEVRPADKFMAAIRDFPTPANTTDVRAWFGLVNQVSYSFAMTAAMLPFRELLKPSTPFEWTDKLSDALTASKDHICSSIRTGVEIFDKGRPTCLATDWSRSGIGFWLTQKTLQVPVVRPILLPGGMASDTSGVLIHPRGRITIRTSGG